MEKPSPTDHETSSSLLERVQSNDERAWQQLTELYGPLVYHWGRHAGLSAEDSADVVQDVFRVLVVHLSRFEKTPSSSFRAWLWTIVRNKIRDHARARDGKVAALGGTDANLRLLSLPDQPPDEGGDSGISPTSGLMYRAIQIVKAEVNETTWIAFWRSSVDEVSPAAVAEELDLSVDSVYQAKSRVLRRLRTLLEM
ncbi:MAG: sigma-70 family RNA polymerase sigma factor [Phycisphaera sp. RhM]|nr:sigma-70 family RNA polymerase sigma factor [Phycisphaera sp. RhM]